MADETIADLINSSPDTSPDATDGIYVLGDPLGTPVNNGVLLGNAITKAHGLSDGIIKVASAVMTDAVEGTDYYAPGGTDVAITDGGTGASSASAALAALGASPFAQTGLKILDAGTHTLTIKDNETLAANRTLSLVTGDANRSLTLTADTTIGGTFSGTSSGTNTGDQTSVSGNAGTATALQNARTIDGVSFNGTANITTIAEATHAATGKTTPVAADEFPIVDSAASNVLKKVTYANLAATILATSTLTGHPTIEGVTATGATGSGLLVFGTSPTLVTPTIAATGFTNMNHTHQAANTGGTLDAAAIAAGTVATARLGSGSASVSKFLTGDQVWTALNVYRDVSGGTISGLAAGLVSLWDAIPQIPANPAAGDTFEFDLNGSLLDGTTGPATKEVKLIVAGVTVFDWTTPSLANGGVTRRWYCRGKLVVATTGGSGTFFFAGRIGLSDSVSGAFGAFTAGNEVEFGRVTGAISQTSAMNFDIQMRTNGSGGTGCNITKGVMALTRIPA